MPSAEALLDLTQETKVPKFKEIIDYDELAEDLRYLHR
jgi:hypothetical protein